MKYIKTLITILFLIVSIINAQEKIKITSSTVVVVKTQQSIQGKNLMEGQELIWAVAADLKVNGKVVIKAGTPVIARVNQIENAGMVGQAGALSIGFESTKAVDGSVVNLSGSLNSKGESSVGTSVAVGLVLCPLALLMKGKDGSFPAGTQSRAMTLGETDVIVQ